MKPITRRRILLVSLVFASGCAAFDAPDNGMIVAAGSRVCTAPSVAECERLVRIGAALHTPDMERAIREAQAFEVIRK